MTTSLNVEMVLPYNSGIPRDVATNHFFLILDAEVLPEDAANSFQELMAIVMNTGATDMTHPLGWYYSDEIDRAHCVAKFYDPSLPGGSPPVETRPLAVAAAGPVGVSMPAEVALCTTWVGEGLPMVGDAELPLRQRRGRTYWGPFNQGAVGTDGAGGVGRPSSTLQADLRLASGVMIASNVARASGFAIFSRKAGDATVITRGWIDNEWDTQRRRGNDATVRSTFELP